ncbi:hypothetical protein [Massilia sp. YIM B02443]|uniref:hypothetical protein n=1 Tax=Massilia sp. YIM B02443 TaxID=3050127 RepID=UPI0025B6869A|nr:hypothetical protein [Massilia sp. YIM B02443]MDN4038650.1 hypothetical protein [Massilia sp. YIM B02443]
MSPGTAAWLASLRAEAEAAGPTATTVTGTVRGRPVRAVIFSDEFVGKSDEELLALVRERLLNP